MIIDKTTSNDSNKCTFVPERAKGVGALRALIIVSFVLLYVALKEPRDECGHRTFSCNPDALRRIIHQAQTTDDIPEAYAPMRAAVRRTFPESEGFKHVLWRMNDMDALIKSDYPVYYDTWKAMTTYTMRGDAARYFILHKYGGLYLDMDYEPIKNFWDFLPRESVGILEANIFDETHVNALMSSPPRDPFWEDVFEVMRVRTKTLASTRKSLYVSGPRMLSAVITSDQRKMRRRTLDCRYWNPHVPAKYGTRAKVGYATIDTLYGHLFCGAGINSCTLGVHHSTLMWNDTTP